MKKKHLILLGVAALLLFAFRKKKTKGHVEVGDLDEGEFIDPVTGEVITIKNTAPSTNVKVDNSPPMLNPIYTNQPTNTTTLPTRGNQSSGLNFYAQERYNVKFI